nr:2-C-methyl-D-erythritol 2,4-cyclodiphosphate synthase [uncultured Desulfuromonas sp.]
MMRIGQGYDVHRLIEDRKLMLGGVDVPHTHGLLGHSDADVLLHAICDAVLGALAMGDIGQHFPDTDPQFKGISSLTLLQRVIELAATRGWRIGNLDSTIVAQRPRLADSLPQMVDNIARVCQVSPDQINVKATTTEKLGFEGRQEGISAQAVVLLTRNHHQNEGKVIAQL